MLAADRAQNARIDAIMDQLRGLTSAEDTMQAAWRAACDLSARRPDEIKPIAHGIREVIEYLELALASVEAS